MYCFQRMEIFEVHECITFTQMQERIMSAPKYGKTHVVKTGVSMPQPLLPIVNAAAAGQGLNRSEFITQILAAHLGYQIAEKTQ